MAYTIYILPESRMTIDGAVLDGVTQGDGSHMVGATLTLDARAWQPVSIEDNDTSFDDNDGGQRLAQPVEIDGETFPARTRVEAEYAMTASDGTNTWTMVAFNFNNSNPNYATVEALAFVGDVGGFPPIGVPLQITSAWEGPRIPAADFARPVCFAAGTRIAVPGGERPVETLRSGDLVMTRERGAEPLLWVGQRTVPAEGDFAPVEFAPGAIGNRRALRVSRPHRIRYSGWQAELLFGEAAVLIPAAHFVNGTTIRSVPGGDVTYVHLMFEGHRTVYAEGAETESFHATARNLAGLTPSARAELLVLFPELAEGRTPFALSHTPLRRIETRALLAG